MSARDDVLNRVRAALGRPGAGTTASGVVGTAPHLDEVPREYRTSGEHPPGSPEVLDQLVDRLVDYRAHVHRTTAADLPAAIATLVTELSGSRAGPGAPEPDNSRAPELSGPRAGSGAPEPDNSRGVRVVVPAGIDDGWLAALPDGTDVVRDSRERPLTAAELDATDAVVTAARIAISETGTIVLDGEPDQGRRAVSLVPDVHLCVVRADQTVQTVPEAVRLLGEHPDRPQTWISGPSATSDIELDRVEGVHGPRTLHVLLVAAPAR
ncbi:lactate utilization protein C [Isoptericola sp. NEAU-Y5]|uniref:Lactate utilization protein C n=1 Tax=Isoptericola luteus TaxID=2879484 RepID=A0ABS7ZB61_9MICO|nr:lactate utilization protein C [Isoptericola sp. NEAU-Y5]MCA5892285.1 lactate utilization protein C [Isoptericola sp. NEAU-Y5]